MGNCFPFNLFRRRASQSTESAEHHHHTIELSSRPAKVLSSAPGPLGRAQARINHLKAKHGSPTGVAGVSVVDAPLLKEPVETEGEIVWIATVLLGTPPMAVMLDLDTASSDLLVEPGIYSPSGSKTSCDVGRPFQVSYGDGTMASGQVWFDRVSIANLSTPSQAIACVTKTTLPGRESAGCIGLGFQSIAQTNNPPLLDSIFAAYRGEIRSLFCLGLWDPSGGGGAYMDIGHINRQRYQGELAWSDVDDSSGYWVTDFTINGGAAAKAVVDTAVRWKGEEQRMGTRAGVDPSRQPPDYAHRRSCQSWVIACRWRRGIRTDPDESSSPAHLVPQRSAPSSRQVDGSRPIPVASPLTQLDACAITSQAANFRVIQQGSEVFGLYHRGETSPIKLVFGDCAFELSQEALHFQSEGSQSVCTIVGSDMGGGSSWILGTSFFRDVYAVFDKGNKRIGFAPRQQTTA